MTAEPTCPHCAEPREICIADPCDGRIEDEAMNGWLGEFE